MNISAGLTNFRDLGGYRTRDGKTVRKGVLYRGAALASLNAEDTAFVGKLGLRTVLDLRSQSEVDAAPDEVPQGAEYVHSSGILSLDSAAGAGSLDMKSLISGAAGDPDTLAKLGQYMVGSYREMALHPQAFVTAFQLLLDEENTPLFFHCTAGKDRTGVCAAYILRVLGVPVETVMEDYLLSNHHRRQAVEESMAQLKGQISSQAILDAMQAMLTVDESYLQANFAAIDEHYGGFDGFVQTGLGLRVQDVAKLQRAYLED